MSNPQQDMIHRLASEQRQQLVKAYTCISQQILLLVNETYDTGLILSNIHIMQARKYPEKNKYKKATIWSPFYFDHFPIRNITVPVAWHHFLWPQACCPE